MIFCTLINISAWCATGRKCADMKKALIVGLNDYPGNELYGCVNDAIAMKELLETNGDGSPNFDIRLVQGSCTLNELKSDIKQLFNDDADIALLYFSGHGAENDGGYLCTTDFSENTYGVRMSDVLDIVHESHCKNKVIILDCCFSAKMGQSILLNDRSVIDPGVTIIAASRPWESSVEASTEIGQPSHGMFTELLLQGLRGGAADITGNITPASLYSFVDQALGAWDQRPVFKSNISQFLPLRNIEARVPREKLRKLKDYFGNPTDEFPLDPSYEYTNTFDVVHEVIEPYANEEHVAILKDLQLFESVGLVEPVGTEHMYFAAMESKGCKLTALGLHYWRLAKGNRI